MRIALIIVSLTMTCAQAQNGLELEALHGHVITNQTSTETQDLNLRITALESKSTTLSDYLATQGVQHAAAANSISLTGIVIGIVASLLGLMSIVFGVIGYITVAGRAAKEAKKAADQQMELISEEIQSKLQQKMDEFFNKETQRITEATDSKLTELYDMVLSSIKPKPLNSQNSNPEESNEEKEEQTNHEINQGDDGDGEEISEEFINPNSSTTSPRIAAETESRAALTVNAAQQNNREVDTINLAVDTEKSPAPLAIPPNPKGAPEDAILYRNYARVLQSQREYEGAIAYYQEAMQRALAEQSPQLYLETGKELAKVLETVKDNDALAILLKELLTRCNPWSNDDLELSLDLLAALTSSNQLFSAKMLIEKISHGIKRGYKSLDKYYKGRFHYISACLLKKTGNKAEAQENLRRAIELTNNIHSPESMTINKQAKSMLFNSWG